MALCIFHLATRRSCIHCPPPLGGSLECGRRTIRDQPNLFLNYFLFKSVPFDIQTKFTINTKALGHLRNRSCTTHPPYLNAGSSIPPLPDNAANPKPICNRCLETSLALSATLFNAQLQLSMRPSLWGVQLRII